MSCDVCNARLNIDSKKSVGELDKWTESGYVCENELTVESFYAQRKLSCVDTVQTHYCNPSGRTKGGRIATKGIYYVCYFDENIVEKLNF